jgi:hypothetical protein
MGALRSSLGRLLVLLSLASVVPNVQADGVGILGAGKWLYKPVCAHTCRYLVRNNPILCESGDDGSSTHDHVRKRQHSHGGPMSPECFLLDKAFLRTIALCMHEQCPRDDVPVSVMEEYWEGHLATGTVGDWSMKPIMSYTDALMLAQEDVAAIGTANVPIAVAGEPLNETSFVDEEAFVKQYNWNLGFEIGESEHGHNRLVAVTNISSQT